MQGDLVIVRAYGGVPLVRRVWKEVNNGVYIADDDRFSRLLVGDSEIQPVGFPREDVFRHDPNLAAAMDSLCGKGEWDWKRLIPY